MNTPSKFNTVNSINDAIIKYKTWSILTSSLEDAINDTPDNVIADNASLQKLAKEFNTIAEAYLKEAKALSAFL